MRPRSRVRTTITAAVAAAALCAVAAGCTSSSDDGARSSGPASGTGEVSGAAPSVNLGSDSRPPSATPFTPSPTPSPTGSGSSTRGTIDDTVPSRTTVTAAPVAIGATARFSSTVTARISAVKSVQGTSRLPGEIAGPAVALTIRVDNGSSRALDLQNVTVTLTDRAEVPAGAISTGSKPFSGRVAAGATASGTYVFSLATNNRQNVTVTVTYTTGAPTLAFVGDVK